MNNLESSRVAAAAASRRGAAVEVSTTQRPTAYSGVEESTPLVPQLQNPVGEEQGVEDRDRKRCRIEVAEDFSIPPPESCAAFVNELLARWTSSVLRQ